MQPITSAAGFARAMRLVMPSLRGYARRLARDDGEDLVQDTLMRAWNSRSGFEPGSNFRAWLFRIARNSFLSGVRRSARNVQWDPEVHDRLLVSPPAQDELLYLRDLRNALNVLPPPSARHCYSSREMACLMPMPQRRLGSSRAR